MILWRPGKINTALPDISTLVSDINNLFSSGCVLEDTNILSELLSDMLKSRFAGYMNESSKATLHMSNIGKPARQLWFELNNVERDAPLSPDLRFKFLYGDVLELLLLFLAEKAGHSVSLQQKEVKLDGVTGHIDAIIDGHLVDCKSASSRSFLKFKTGSIIEDDPFAYIFQLSGYFQALEEEGVPLKGAAFLAIDKQFGHICLCPIDIKLMRTLDVKARIRLDREVERLKELPQELCHEDVPDGKSGNLKVSTACSYCGWLHRCRTDIVGVFQYSTGPKFLTKILSEPRVPRLDSFQEKEEGLE